MGNIKEAQVNEATNEMLKASMKAEMELMIHTERQATRQFLQALLDERKQYLPDKPLLDMPSFTISKPKDIISPSGKASCSIAKGILTTSKEKGTSECQLFWPNLDNEVAKRVVYHSSLEKIMLHNRPLKNGQVKVEIETVVQGQGGVELPFPTDEVGTMLEVVGQFIAWPDHLVLPIKPSSVELPKEKEMRKTNTKESGIGSADVNLVPSIIDDFQWIIEEFGDSSIRRVKIPQNIFSRDNLEISIGKEEIQIWFDKREIDDCHVSLYMRYLFETHSGCAGDMFGFICPRLISPNGDVGTIKDRATYIASAMTGNIENRMCFAPYQFGKYWVLLVLHPHFGYAYWIDPLHGDQVANAENLVNLSYTLTYTSLGQKKPRRQPMWQVIKCPRQQNSIESGYYVLRFMREIILRRSVIIPKIWYGKKDTYSDDEIDETRKEWIEYLLRLVF